MTECMKMNEDNVLVMDITWKYNYLTSKKFLIIIYFKIVRSTDKNSDNIFQV